MTQCGADAFVCPSTGPAKKLGGCDEPRGHWVLFDVPCNSAELGAIADPAVPRLVFPKRLASASENPVGLPSGRTFEPARDCGQGNQGCQQQMNVVRHENPGMQFIEAPASLTIQNLFRDYLRNLGIRQPLRPLRLPIQLAIFGCKSVAGRRVRFQQVFSLAYRHRTPQAPVEEYRDTFGMQMRQSSSIVKHWADESVCPTLVRCGAFVLG